MTKKAKTMSNGRANTIMGAIVVVPVIILIAVSMLTGQDDTSPRPAASPSTSFETDESTSSSSSTTSTSSSSSSVQSSLTPEEEEIQRRWDLEVSRVLPKHPTLSVPDELPWEKLKSSPKGEDFADSRPALGRTIFVQEIGAEESSRCSMGAWARTDGGELKGITAGHCGDVGQQVQWLHEDGTRYVLGEIEFSEPDDPDYPTIDLHSDFANGPASNVARFGDRGHDVVVADVDDFHTWDPGDYKICKKGSATETTCGGAGVGDTDTTLMANVWGAGGDSGDPMYAQRHDDPDTLTRCTCSVSFRDPLSRMAKPRTL